MIISTAALLIIFGSGITGGVATTLLTQHVCFKLATPCMIDVSPCCSCDEGTNFHIQDDWKTFVKL